MIIVNEKSANQKVKTSLGVLTFNKYGETEVSKEIGEKLISQYGYFEKGNKPQPKVEPKKEVVTDEAAKERIAELEQKLLVSGQKLEKAEGDLRLSKEEVESWKAEYTKATTAEKPETLVTSTIPELQENDINVVIDLWNKGINDLATLCEGLSLPKDEWKELKKKELVVYLAKKTLYSK